MGFDQDVRGSVKYDGVLEAEEATVVPGIAAPPLADDYSVAGIEVGGTGQEASAGGPFLIGEHLRLSRPGMVIDGRMDVVETNPTADAVPDRTVAACWSSPARTTTVRDPAPTRQVKLRHSKRRHRVLRCASARVLLYCSPTSE